MKAWFSLTEQNKKDIFNQVSAQTGLPTVAIEKDWWVTMALRVVFSLPFSEHLVFKGGTSLSKGWNLIDRFSEDIDLAIDRNFLGFEGDLSKSQVKKLRKASCSFISGDFIEAIEHQFNELDIPEVALTIQDFKDSDTDPLVVELNYKALTDPSAYIQPRVLIEIGARSLMEPFEGRNIRSLVGEQYDGKSFADDAILIPTVLPKRTFLEKIFLLHEEFQKPIKSIRVDRLSRHLYDLEKIMDTDHGKEAVKDDDLYQSIIAHREKFNIIRGIDYTHHARDKINFIPPKEIMKAWEKDYHTMTESMIYGETKSFKLLIERLKALRDRMTNT